MFNECTGQWLREAKRLHATHGKMVLLHLDEIQVFLQGHQRLYLRSISGFVELNRAESELSVMDTRDTYWNKLFLTTGR